MQTAQRYHVRELDVEHECYNPRRWGFWRYIAVPLDRHTKWPIHKGMDRNRSAGRISDLLLQNAYLENLERLTKRLRHRGQCGVVEQRDFIVLVANGEPWSSHAKTQRLPLRVFDLSDSR